MGKKKPEEMATHRTIFREGAAKKEISAAVADEVFDLMEKFAGYGFNKAHADRVLAARLSHGVDQDPLRGRVLRRQHVGRDRQQRQAEGAHRRRARPSA
jgi:hypothetical protein